MSLIYKGKNLNYKNKFHDYGIKSEDTIFLFPGIRGYSYGGSDINIYMKYKDQLVDIRVCSKLC